MNILALCAHPDDVEFICAGTLLKYREAGHRIFIALATSGNIGSNSMTSREDVARTRERKQSAAAAMLGAELKFLRYDVQLLTDTPEVRREILNAVRWADPDVILTNYPGDNSTHHAITGRIVGRVLLSCGSKLIPSDRRMMAEDLGRKRIYRFPQENWMPIAAISVSNELAAQLFQHQQPVHHGDGRKLGRMGDRF